MKMELKLKLKCSILYLYLDGFFGSILKVYVSKYFLERNLKVSVTFSKKYLYQITLNRSVSCSRNVESRYR